jgi:sugar phosphate isomerase/epimerase
MALGPADLVLCAGTLQNASLRERIDAAVAGGFRGLSLFASDYRRARAEGSSDADIRALLVDHDLEIAELDPLITWLPGTSSAAIPMFDATEDEFYAIRDAIGARSINAIVFAPKPVADDELSDAFGALCERGAAHEMLVHLEFMPWTQISNALEAWEVVRCAGHSNGGIMLDTWHHFRGSLSDDDLATKVPTERIFAVQLDDAPAEAEADVIAETLNRRRLPGDGDIDLPRILRMLREGGSPAPLGVEVFAEELFEQDPNEVARRCGDATRVAIAASTA